MMVAAGAVREATVVDGCRRCGSRHVYTTDGLCWQCSEKRALEVGRWFAGSVESLAEAKCQGASPELVGLIEESDHGAAPLNRATVWTNHKSDREGWCTACHRVVPAEDHRCA